MTQTLCILGRQPSLGLAELESLLGAEALQPVGNGAVLIDKDPSEITFDRLGGTIKLAKLLTRLGTTEWRDIEKYLIDTIPDHLQYVPEGKFKLGLSVYGLQVSVRTINASGLSIKKVIKATGRSVRIIPNKQPELNTAQVLHNQLTGPTGWELIIIRDGKTTLLAQTVRLQDIEAYAARDQVRPKRDAKVGMLPPKLAQLIINFATGKIKEGEGLSAKGEVNTVLDPFCGTGVVLQEALLMGYNVIATDLDERMVEYTKANLEWLNITALEQHVRQGDATSTTWDEPFDTIAAETYLGRPFSADPKPEVLREVIQDVDTIHRKFLRNVAKQTPAGFRMCIAIPAWKTRNGFQHLKVLDSLEELGYTRVSFVHAVNKDLIYHREGQFVGRELIVLVRV